MFDDQPTLSPQDELKRILGLGVLSRPNAVGAPPAPQPASTIGGVVPAAPQAAAAVAPIAMPNSPTPIMPTQTQTDQSELSRLKNSSSGIDQFRQKHPILGTIAKIGEIAGSSLFPGVAANIPGTDLHHSQLVNREQGRVNQDLAGEQEQAKTAGVTAGTAHTEAETGAIPTHTRLEEAQADALSEPKPKEEEWDVVQGFAGPNGEPILKEKNSGQMKLATSVGAKITKPEKPDNPEQQFVDEYQHGHPGSSIAQAQKAFELNKPPTPQQPQRVLGVGPDGVVKEITPGMKLEPGTKTVTGDLAGNKPTADEQRRADLTENLNENLGALEDIVNRKPELFGPIHGRMTGIRAAIGTGDPDIAALETIKHQIGMAQISAHGMRSAHGIESASESILNSFHNSPEAVKGAIQAARNSVKTFTGDVDRAKGAPQAPAGQEIHYKIVNGQLVPNTH